MYSGYRQTLKRWTKDSTTALVNAPPPLSLSFSPPLSLSFSPGYANRLAKFRLTVQPESSSSSTAYTYTEPDTEGQATYTVVPPPSVINFPVSQVRFDARSDGVGEDILTLCEVFVYGGEFMEGSFVEVNLVLIRWGFRSAKYLIW